MSDSKNYAVLFSGGGKLQNNYSRYYSLTKKTYETLLDRGIDPSNIIIAYADGNLNKAGNSIYYNTNASDQIDSQGILKDFFAENPEIEILFEEIIASTQEDNEGKSFLTPATASETEKKLKKIKELTDNAKSKQVLFDYDIIPINGKQYLKYELFSKSDFSYALSKGSKVVPANQTSLDEAINGNNSRLKTIDNDDSLFVWTFDHGSHASNEDVAPKETIGQNLGSLVSWESANINPNEFASIFRNVINKSKNTTFALAQCYSGALLEELVTDQVLSTSNQWFGMAATNQYEVSWGTGFADGIVAGLGKADNGITLFNTAKANDIHADKGYYKPNSYPYKSREQYIAGLNFDEHPWSAMPKNENNPLFVGSHITTKWEKNGVEILSSSDSFERPSTINMNTLEDNNVNIVSLIENEIGPIADFKLEGITSTRLGTLSYAPEFRSLTYTPFSNAYGEEQFSLRINDGKKAHEFNLSLDITSVNDAPLAVDDFIDISGWDNRNTISNSVKTDTIINVDNQPGFLDDTDVDGDNTFIKDFSLTSNGKLNKIGEFLFEYRPNSGFVGQDSFFYVLSDGEAYDVAKVTINVLAPGDYV